MTDLRLILAAETDQLPNETGFIELAHDGVIHGLSESGLWFGPRATLEDFDAYRQLIPYVVVVYDGKIVTYTRTPKGGESRLHGKVSFGAGGHIDLEDAVTEDGKFSLESTLQLAATRELNEELGIIAGQLEFRGLLTNLTDEVGRVHQGVVSVYHCTERPSKIEDALGDVTFSTVEELRAVESRLETWSALLLPYLSDLIAVQK